MVCRSENKCYFIAYYIWAYGNIFFLLHRYSVNTSGLLSLLRHFGCHRGSHFYARFWFCARCRSTCGAGAFGARIMVPGSITILALTWLPSSWRTVTAALRGGGDAYPLFVTLPPLHCHHHTLYGFILHLYLLPRFHALPLPDTLRTRLRLRLRYGS